MLSDLEHGRMTRRQLAVSLAALAAGASAVPVALAAPTNFRAVSINHVTVKSPTCTAPRSFTRVLWNADQATVGNRTYPGSGGFVFCHQQGESKTATVDHYDFGIAAFNADAVRAKLAVRGLKADNSQESFKFVDPDGFHVQVNAPDYVGHVS